MNGKSIAPGHAAALTVVALLAFASNSLLCRAALRPGLIDAATFTSVRMLTGALMLTAVACAGSRRWTLPGGGHWPAAMALFAYAALFSFAYLRLDAGPGALILFGSVQATMIGWGMLRGHTPKRSEWLGLVVALAGLILLTAPGLSAPDPGAALLMAMAGAAWGVYSLLGKRAADPIAANAGNFLRSVPLAALASALAAGRFHYSKSGLALAAASGALTSGLGYAIWYAALRELSAPRAAIVQLAVPVLAALGAVAVLGERLSLRLVASGALVLGGIALALKRK